MCRQLRLGVGVKKETRFRSLTSLRQKKRLVTWADVPHRGTENNEIVSLIKRKQTTRPQTLPSYPSQLGRVYDHPGAAGHRGSRDAKLRTQMKQKYANIS